MCYDNHIRSAIMQANQLELASYRDNSMSNINFENFLAACHSKSDSKEPAQIAFIEAVYNHAGADNYKAWVDPFAIAKPADELNGFESGNERTAFFTENYDVIMAFAKEASELYEVDILDVFLRHGIKDTYGNQMTLPDDMFEAVFLNRDLQHPMANVLIDNYICRAVSGSAIAYRIWARLTLRDSNADES